MTDYFGWNDRKTRKRECVSEVFVPVVREPMLAEPMEVEESDPSQTWIGRIFRWPKGTP